MILILFSENSGFISVLLFPFYFLLPGIISKRILASVLCRFKDNDAMVLKAGMRGRRDASGAFNRDILVVTPIGIDHTDYLNKAKTEVAGEKIIIASENSKFILVPQLSDVCRKITDYAKEKSLKFKYIDGNYAKNNQT